MEQNIGISKEYNNFELIKELAMKDVLKANRIAQYFEKNPKSNPIQMTLPVLFNYFSNLLECPVSASPEDEDGKTREEVVKTEIEDNDNNNLTIPQVVTAPASRLSIRLALCAKYRYEK